MKEDITEHQVVLRAIDDLKTIIIKKDNSMSEHQEQMLEELEGINYHVNEVLQRITSKERFGMNEMNLNEVLSISDTLKDLIKKGE